MKMRRWHFIGVPLCPTTTAVDFSSLTSVINKIRPTMASTRRVARPRPWPRTQVTQPRPCRARAAAGPPAGDAVVGRNGGGS